MDNLENSVQEHVEIHKNYFFLATTIKLLFLSILNNLLFLCGIINIGHGEEEVLQKEGISEDECKDAEAEAQQVTDKFISLIEKHLESKEKEIMAV